MKKESSLASMPKLILAVVLIVGIVMIIWLMGCVAIKEYPYNKISSIFIICPDTVRDIDGNIYGTVKIGSQCWMKENLKVTKNSYGDTITRFCYDNDTNICNTDGGLYDWNTTMNGSTKEGAQGICPAGWHIPRALEWQVLKKSLPTKMTSELKYTDCVDLKESWNYCSPEQQKERTYIKFADFTNFNLSFSGARFDNNYSNLSDNYYSNKFISDYFWSSTQEGIQISGMRIDKTFYTFYHNKYLKSIYDKANGFSIRCLKD